jgi:hypothetical protein
MSAGVKSLGGEIRVKKVSGMSTVGGAKSVNIVSGVSIRCRVFC